MEKNEAQNVTQGALVDYRGRLYRVASVKLGDIAGPHFRLLPEGNYPPENLTSYRLVKLLADDPPPSA